MKKIIILILVIAIAFMSYLNLTKPKETPMIKEKESMSEVSFIAVGDNLIHSPIYREADKNEGTSGDEKYNFNYAYKQVKPYIKSADLSFINQETVLGGGKPKNYPNFNTPNSMADALADTGFDVVNGSNNHSMDMGLAGLKHSIEVFKKHADKLTYIGVYENKEAYNHIPVINKKGIKIAFLSYTYGLNGRSSYGAVKLFDKELITKEVKEAKKQADFVVVSAHWGTEYHHQINSMQKEYSGLFTSLDVDLVIGAHPHVIQKMEYQTNTNGHRTLIAYSLGNFISCQNTLSTSLGGMLSCSFNKQGNKCSIKNISFIPIVNHMESGHKKPFSNLCHIQPYALKDYTETLAKKHTLNGYKNITVTKEHFKNLTDKVMGNNFKIQY
ncbi:CapA family protein [Eggerthia catenaformis]|uniref:CapA family protein n=1 Tax=Eggerthia catenaformis TaxID=31973 RepID=UPI00248D3EAE|nr:CapA family protein [Eggerthia catenaformis]